jgi:nucleotide-binding universal stress UspA family protein
MAPEMTRTILAALDSTAAAAPVLDAARAIADLLDVGLEAIHVPENGHTTVTALAHAAGVPLRLVNGPALDALSGALSADDILLAVLGIRRKAVAGEPIGHIALPLVQQAHKPVIAVPPGFLSRELDRLKHVLVPLDGTRHVARGMEPSVQLLSGAGVRVVALHVFDHERIPRFSDQPHHEILAWEKEFLARHCPGAVLQTRLGRASPAILEAALTERVGIIALGWRRDLSAGRAAVVRDLLTRSTVPILLVPLPPT